MTDTREGPGSDAGIVRVERLASGGAGIARMADGRVAFVEGGCPGDLVRIEIAEDRRSYVRAKLVEIVEGSQARVRPGCPHADECGGCQWRHVDYREQLAAKRAEVADALERIAKLDPGLVAETVPSPIVEGYRNKVEFAVRTDGRRVELLYHGEDAGVAVDRCDLLPQRLRGAPRSLSGALSFLLKGRDLGIERVALRVSERTRDVEVALWGEPGEFPRRMAGRVLAEAVGATSVVRVLTKSGKKRRRVSGVEVLSGRGYWTERMSGFHWMVSAPSFFQVNTAAAESLVELVSSAVLPDETLSVLDLFSGVGTFTLPLADAGAHVTAVEGEGSAVRDLRRNLDRSGLFAEVEPGEASRVLARAMPVDIAVVDPPRSGLQPEATAALVALRPGRLVYVSCDPATLARDLSSLVAAGYSLASVTPLDLFPHTYHVESVAALHL